METSDVGDVVRLTDTIDKLDVGLIGYSFGGGVADNLSTYLFNQANAGNAPGTLSVAYAGTIDPIVYLTGGIPLLTSPATLWGGVGFNYYESQGGAALTDGSSNQLFGPSPPYVHVTIGFHQYVFDSLEDDLALTYDSFSG
jgi:hypothetical protein